MEQNNLQHVDLVSLDIEGAEIMTLQKFPFHKYDISVWIVETFWLEDRDIDRIFLTNGYVKAAQLALDSVYVKMSFLLSSRKDNMWYHEKEKSQWL